MMLLIRCFLMYAYVFQGLPRKHFVAPISSTILADKVVAAGRIRHWAQDEIAISAALASNVTELVTCSRLAKFAVADF